MSATNAIHSIWYFQSHLLKSNGDSKASNKEENMMNNMVCGGLDSLLRLWASTGVLNVKGIQDKPTALTGCGKANYLL